MNEVTLITIAGWLILSMVMGMIGDSKTIGFWSSFLLSLILSPVIGAFAILVSKDKQTDIFEKEVLKYLSRKIDNSYAPLKSEAIELSVEGKSRYPKFTKHDILDGLKYLSFVLIIIILLFIGLNQIFK
jgi:hypothetical protein